MPGASPWLGEFGLDAECEHDALVLPSGVPSHDRNNNADSILSSSHHGVAAHHQPSSAFPALPPKKQSRKLYLQIFTGFAFLPASGYCFLPEKIHETIHNTLSSKTVIPNYHLIVDFTHALQPVITTYLASNWPPSDGLFFVPFIIRNGILLCPYPQNIVLPVKIIANNWQ
jgi:hypothetical protein